MERKLEQEEIRRRMKKLQEKIIEAEKAYYIDAAPIMTDIAYDKLFDTLVKLEEEYPEWKDPCSPTTRIGSDMDNALPERKHSVPVLSLDKCYSVDDLMNWTEKMEEKFPGKIELVVEPKIDGSGVVLYYENGELVMALTRGNGYIGNDITENVKTIRSIPLKIADKRKLAVRGEIYITRDDFEKYNAAHGENNYANPRNLASGCSRRLKSKEVALCPLRVFVYECFTDASLEFVTHIESILFLKNNGFPVNPYLGFFGNHGGKNEKIDPLEKGEIGTLREIPDYVERFKEIRKKLNYDIDGLVIKINNLAIREELGLTNHHPRWAIAYKFDAPLAQTKVEDIIFQVGRGGRITPVAILEPVGLAGSTIARATLHNEDYLNMLGINVGDLVTISKRGDIIPAVEEVLEKGEHIETYSFPRICPSCSEELWKEGAHHFCQNKHCPKRMLGTLQYFVGRSQMNIDTLGDKTLEFLFEKGWIQHIYDIYEFDYSRLKLEEGFGDKKIENIIRSIELSKENPFEIVLASLGLKEIGSKIAEILVQYFGTIDILFEKASLEDPSLFSCISGIGEGIAKLIIENFTDPDIIYLIKRLRENGLQFQGKLSEKKEEQFLKETKWVITGSFEYYRPREKAAVAIKEFGGEVVNTVSSKTSFLLCGSEAGSKLEKAKQLGIRVIGEEEFRMMIEEKVLLGKNEPKERNIDK